MTAVDRIVYEFLTRTGTGLYTLIGTRVDFAMVTEGFTNSQARVVFRTEDGAAARWGSPYHDRAYIFECYGGTNADFATPMAVYQALHDVWHDERKITVTSGVFMGGWEEQAGIPLVHPITKHKLITCRMAAKLRGA